MSLDADTELDELVRRYLEYLHRDLRHTKSKISNWMGYPESATTGKTSRSVLDDYLNRVNGRFFRIDHLGGIAVGLGISATDLLGEIRDFGLKNAGPTIADPLSDEAERVEEVKKMRASGEQQQERPAHRVAKKARTGR